MPKLTVKQTTLAKDTMGNFNRQSDSSAYLLKKVKAETTNRETYTTDYTGNLEGQMKVVIKLMLFKNYK